MNILLIGSGGREHALAWKLAQSSRVQRIFVAPGNGGTATAEKCQNVPISADNLPELRQFAQENAVELTVAGPEAPLVAGVVDFFAAEGLPVFGPSQAAAQLEGSKAFSKEFMQRHRIPTGWARAFTNFDEAADFVRGLEALPVLKASGLAAGKGVLLPESWDEAVADLREMLVEGRFGPASQTVLVEERLRGPELSVLAFCDGETVRLMPDAQDHKRLLNGDRGPNTGGMGAFAPSPLATPELLAAVEASVLRPALAGMAAEGTPYRGVLYAGLMLTADGPKVLEFNCRFGDPEAQVILPLLQSDLLEILQACVSGELSPVEPAWADEAAVTVVLASGGYPGAYATGKPIRGLAAAAKAGGLVFHAGTERTEAGEVVTAGGRVLTVTGVRGGFPAARQVAYEAIDRIQFEQAVWRTDIGHAL